MLRFPFHFVKEHTWPLRQAKSVHQRHRLTRHSKKAVAAEGHSNDRAVKWWSQAGSNRRPPACKADALPAELWPHGLVGLGGLEPPTSPLSGVRSNRLSYRPALGCRQIVGGRLVLLGNFVKGGDPAAGSPTATLLRLHPSH